MNTAGIKRGDVVECNVRGDVFLAHVQAKGRAEDARLRARELRVLPVCSNRGHHIRIVTSRQITAHWRKAKGGVTRVTDED